ncbi:hypothetical protein VE02_08889 [Pseudogymnoascus sp. 03VT05]|nr:hypothetical protein VE02_08889 [Pseudogymnoascus sp. 03VT05]
MADFSKFGEISNEWNDYVRIYGTPPPLPVGKVALEKLQETTNRSREEASMRHMAQEDITSKVEIETIHISAPDNYSIPVRIYKPKHLGVPTSTPKLPIYLFYHGGGFMFGTLDSEDAGCSRIVVYMDIIVVNICYRHTPQHPFPAAPSDALDSFDWVSPTVSEDLANFHLLDYGTS